MKTIEETRRGMFEVWVQYRQFLKRNRDGSYNEEWVEARWIGFNAALDAVVIELPHLTQSVYATRDELSCAEQAIAWCADSIESTNLGLKIR